ncbi:MAG: DNA polymerase III subunit delta [Stenomitos rutilans HA7619-LM2]|jgi:DNA polymerase-3 subunit delta|nr:DNA polymerase III subunit delta [Stenomitos rutilans HA7619-LM2]
MPVHIFVGDDTYTLNQALTKLKRSLHSTWQAFNCHAFSAAQLPDALMTAQTPPLGDMLRVVVVEQCQFYHFGAQQLAQLQIIAHLPETTTLVFTAASIDKRLKVVKHLLKHGTLQEFVLIPPWRTDLIADAITHQAKVINLTLPKDVLLYLVEAIGNDTARLASELQKLATFAQGQRLTKQAVQQLVPCQTQTSLQLAEAMRQGDVSQVLGLLHELMSRAEVPLVIVATLLTQCRTWLWVKSALSDRARRSDTEIAHLCGLGNPKRLYYLRQEVAKLSVNTLVQAVTQLLALEVSLKQGEGAALVLPKLIAIAHLFKR